MNQGGGGSGWVPGKVRRVLLLMGGLALFGSLSLIGGRQVQGLPGFCATCHNAAYQEWKSSGAAVNHPVCIECHSGAGIVEAVVSEVRGGLRVAGFFAGADPAAAKAQVSDQNCTKCHGDRELLTREHHSAIPARAPLSFCSNCHLIDAAGEDADDHSSPALTPQCSTCHAHSDSFGGTLSLPAEGSKLKSWFP